jgi:hypothetical protein
MHQSQTIICLLRNDDIGQIAIGCLHCKSVVTVYRAGLAQADSDNGPFETDRVNLRYRRHDMKLRRLAVSPSRTLCLSPAHDTAHATDPFSDQVFAIQRDDRVRPHSSLKKRYPSTVHPHH